MHNRYTTGTQPIYNHYSTGSTTVQHRYSTGTPPVRHRCTTSTPPVPPGAASCHVERASEGCVVVRALKQGCSVRMEACVGCIHPRFSTLASSSSWSAFGLGRAAGLHDGRVRRQAQRGRRREAVQQAAPSTSKFSERNCKPSVTSLKLSRSRSAFAIVHAALTPEQLDGGSALTSVKDYNSALLSCVRYAISSFTARVYRSSDEMRLELAFWLFFPCFRLLAWPSLLLNRFCGMLTLRTYSFSREGSGREGFSQVCVLRV